MVALIAARDSACLRACPLGERDATREPERARRALQARGDAQPLARHQHAGQPAADLAGVAHRIVDAIHHRPLEIRIGADQVGRLASQFQMYALDSRRCQFHHPPAGTHRTREGHHVHERVGRYGFAHFRPGTANKVEHTWRKARFGGNVGKHEGR